MKNLINPLSLRDRRKTNIMRVWLVSSALPAYLMFDLSRQRQWLELAGTCFAFVLTGYIVYLLIKEIEHGKILSEQLSTQSEHYRTTISSMTEGLVTTGSSGEISYMNPAAERITGWNLDEVHNLPLHAVYSIADEETGKPLEPIVTRILRDGKTVEVENNTILFTKNQQQLIISNSGSPLFDVNGHISGAVLVFNDNTKNKKTETELKEREKQYRTLIENLPEAVYTCDPNGNIQLYNKAAIELWGREPDLVKDRWCGSWRIFNPDGSPCDTFPVQKAFADGKPIAEQEITIERPDGSRRHVLSYPSRLSDASGRLTGIVNMLIDVSEIKEKERLIKQSEEKYRSLIEEASDAILIFSFDGTIYEFNKSSYELLGYSLEEYKQLNLNDILVEDIITNYSNYAAVLEGDTKTVYRHLKRKDGSIIEVEITVKLLADGKAISFTRDITQRRKAEEAIKKEKDLLEAVINSLPGIFYLLDENLSFIRWNRNFEKVSGYSSSEIRAMAPLDFFVKDEQQKVAAKIAQIMVNGEGYQDANLYTKDRKQIPYYFTGFKMENHGETQYVGMAIDISQMKDAETRMKTAIERYDILARATSDTIWDWDILNDKMVYNEGISQIFGYQISEVVNVVNWWYEKLHRDDFNQVHELIKDIHEKKSRRFQLTYRFRCADNSYKYIYDRAFVLYDSSNRPVRMIGAMQDITYAKEEEKRLAKAIIDAQEQERRFIGGELHDNVNQILACALLTLDMAKSSAPNHEELVEFTERTKEYTLMAIGEIRKLSHNLVPATWSNHTLKDTFESLLSSINVTNRFIINFHFDERIQELASEDIQVNLYRILQEQVKNIIKHSEADKLEVEVTYLGKSVHMRIFDNGKGFDISETKMGIGLGNMKRRVESLEGKYTINTQPGKGCEIIMDLPL